jgi:predicted ATP-dependent endonuclease of OLD family
MAVHISDLEVLNFRSCISTSLQLTSFTPLVGLNNCGKSNCLTALQWIVRKTKLGAEDFHDPGQPVQVTGTLVGITDADLEVLEGKHPK